MKVQDKLAVFYHLADPRSKVLQVDNEIFYPRCLYQ